METKNAYEAQKFFMTSVSLVTSYGPHGKNVMAVEWTMQISYNPMLIAVFIHDGSSTLGNIRHSKEFGVNVASEEQSTLVSIAGGYSRKELDKLSISDSFQVLRSRGRLPMLTGCVINAECKLVAIKKIGDHNMVVGRVISIRHDEKKRPLVYHRNRYFKIGSMIEPERQKITVDKETFDLFSPPGQNNFILKCVGVLVRSENKILIFDDKRLETVKTIPYICPKKGKDNKKELENYLHDMRLRITLREKPQIKRLVIKHRNKNQRINFILFDGVLKNQTGPFVWKSPKRDSFLKSLIR